MASVTEEHVFSPLAAQAGYTHAILSPSNTCDPKLPIVSQLSIYTVRSLLLYANALDPIVITLLGIKTDESDVQDWKAPDPIVTTPLGIVNEVSEIQL